MIARDSSATLPRALNSIKSIVDEIIVVDTGSSDATVEVARRYGARILDAVWNDNFSEVRNIGLEAAQSRWILVLDSDEWMLPKDAAMLRNSLEEHESLSRPDRVAFRLLNRSLPGKGIGTGCSAFLTRLFPAHKSIRFEYPVHEQTDTSLLRAGYALKDLPIQILHDGYTDPAVRLQKQARNLRILQKQITGAPPHPITLFLMAGCFLDLNQVEEALFTYQLCFREAAQQNHIVAMAGATVRVATCLFRLGRLEEAHRFCSSVEGSPTEHPEFLITHALALAALEQKEAASTQMEKILTLPDVPRMPPCDHGAALFQATRWLTEEAFNLRASGR